MTKNPGSQITNKFQILEIIASLYGMESGASAFASQKGSIKAN